MLPVLSLTSGYQPLLKAGWVILFNWTVLISRLAAPFVDNSEHRNKDLSGWPTFYFALCGDSRITFHVGHSIRTKYSRRPTRLGTFTTPRITIPHSTVVANILFRKSAIAVASYRMKCRRLTRLLILCADRGLRLPGRFLARHVVRVLGRRRRPRLHLGLEDHADLQQVSRPRPGVHRLRLAAARDFETGHVRVGRIDKALGLGAFSPSAIRGNRRSKRLSPVRR